MGVPGDFGAGPQTGVDGWEEVGGEEGGEEGVEEVVEET